MRYFSNALEDRRVFYIRDSGIKPYAGLPRTSSAQNLTAGTLNSTPCVSDIPNTNPVDLFTNTNLGSSNSSNSSNSFKLLSSVNDVNDVNGAWSAATGAQAVALEAVKTPALEAVKTPAEKDFEERYGTEIPRKEDGSIDTEAMVQAVVDYHVKDGLNAEGFSAERFTNAGNDERMAMLGDMRKQNDAAKAAEFEEDMRLAMERDAAAKAAENPQTQQDNTLGMILNAVVQGLQLCFA